jgi:hypothetical protein
MTDPADTTGAAAPEPEAQAGPTPQTEPPAGPSVQPEASAAEPEPKRQTIIDAVADLLQMVVNYLRQEAAALMRDKVVLPGQQLGRLIAFAFAAAFALALGIGYVSVAVLLLLAQWLGWPGALALIGGILIAGAAIFTWLKVRSIQT